MKRIIYPLTFISILLFAVSCNNDDDEITDATVDVESVSISSSSLTLNVGDTETLTVTVNPEDATDTTVYWSSSDESVATVEDGIVTGIAEGTASITVTTDDGGYTATCEVTVSEDSDEDSDDSDELSAGCILFSFIGSTQTQLMDSVGDYVKTWTSSYAAQGSSYLSSDNTLLRQGASNSLSSTSFSGGGGASGHIEELDDDSNVLWSIDLATDEGTLHHDFKEIDENTIIALMWDIVTISGTNYWNDNVVIIDKESNEITWQWSAYDDGNITPSGSTKDYIHLNSVDYDADNGTILISSRILSTVYEIDKASKEIVATYTAGDELIGQHDAHYLDNGNILVFNNGTTGSNTSNITTSIYELDESDNIVEEYTNSSFESNFAGGAQILDNGNIFICYASMGAFLEINSDGEELWNYTPTNNTGSGNDYIFKARKYTSY